jgi:hypothetical protein
VSRNGWKVVVGLGVAGCLFGAYMLQYLVRFYREDDLPLLAVPSVAVVVLAIGLGKTRGIRAALIAFVVGGAAIGGGVFLGQKFREDMMAEIHHELGINAAAEAVCNGTPNLAAEPAKGKRKLLQGSKWPDMTGYGIGTWEGFPAPSSLAELQLVVCRVGTKNMTDSCSYDNKAGGTYTIYIYQSSETLTVRDAKTAEVLDVKTFEGEKPSGKCDSSVSVPKYETSRDSTGMSPDREAEAAWVRTFVAPAEN